MISPIALLPSLMVLMLARSGTMAMTRKLSKGLLGVRMQSESCVEREGELTAQFSRLATMKR
jgi:hypothetical protein